MTGISGRRSVFRLIPALMILLSLVGVRDVLADTAASTSASVSVGPATGSAFSVAISGSTFSTVPYRAGTSFQNANGSIVVTVADTRGTGAGWTVTLAANGDLRSGAAAIPIANLSFQPASVQGRNGANPNGIDRAALATVSSRPQRILAAQSGSGQGTFDCTFQGTIRVPDRTAADTYTTTLTVTLTSGS
jgi:spore coat protein U-like protein